MAAELRIDTAATGGNSGTKTMLEIEDLEPYVVNYYSSNSVNLAVISIFPYVLFTSVGWNKSSANRTWNAGTYELFTIPESHRPWGPIVTGYMNGSSPDSNHITIKVFSSTGRVVAYVPSGGVNINQSLTNPGRAAMTQAIWYNKKALRYWAGWGRNSAGSFWYSQDHGYLGSGDSYVTGDVAMPVVKLGSDNGLEYRYLRYSDFNGAYNYFNATGKEHIGSGAWHVTDYSNLDPDNAIPNSDAGAFVWSEMGPHLAMTHFNWNWGAGTGGSDRYNWRDGAQDWMTNKTGTNFSEKRFPCMMTGSGNQARVICRNNSTVYVQTYGSGLTFGNTWQYVPQYTLMSNNTYATGKVFRAPSGPYWDSPYVNKNIAVTDIWGGTWGSLYAKKQPVSQGIEPFTWNTGSDSTHPYQEWVLHKHFRAAFAYDQLRTDGFPIGDNNAKNKLGSSWRPYVLKNGYKGTGTIDFGNAGITALTQSVSTKPQFMCVWSDGSFVCHNENGNTSDYAKSIIWPCAGWN